MKLLELFGAIDEVAIDNVKGIGNVPNNQEVDYLGLRVLMRPSKFLDLAAHILRSDATAANSIKAHIGKGGSISSPFLILNIPEEWNDGDLSKPAEIVGHDGRNRMTAVQETEGDHPIEVHLFPRIYRNRHMKPEWIARLNRGMIPERLNKEMPGPWFTLVSGSKMSTEGR